MSGAFPPSPSPRRDRDEKVHSLAACRGFTSPSSSLRKKYYATSLPILGRILLILEGKLPTRGTIQLGWRTKSSQPAHVTERDSSTRSPAAPAPGFQTDPFEGAFGVFRGWGGIGLRMRAAIVGTRYRWGKTVLLATPARLRSPASTARIFAVVEALS